jgi:hypothetical protein
MPPTPADDRKLMQSYIDRYTQKSALPPQA